MSALASGLALAVIASVALNASFLLQHAGSRDAPELSAQRPLVSLRALLGSRVWLVGGAAGLTGWALYIVALTHAPLSLVQAFAAGALALTVPAAARAFGQRLPRGELTAVLALVAALVLLGLGASAPQLTGVPVAALSAALALSTALAVALVSGMRGARTLGTAGGVLYGAADAATKAVTVDAHGSLAAGLSSPWLAAVVVLSVAAFACSQRGLQIGPAVPVIALMTAGTNAAAILIGLIAFGEPLGATPGAAALHIVAFALIALAGLRLAAAQAAVGEAAGRRRLPDRATMSGSPPISSP